MNQPRTANQIVAMLANMQKFGELDETGNPSSPAEGTDDSHACLMNMIDMARASLAATPQDERPIVWVEVDNGRVNNVVADRPCRVVVTDLDLEAADDDDDYFVEHAGNELFLYKSFCVADVDPETAISLFEKAEMARA